MDELRLQGACSSEKEADGWVHLCAVLRDLSLSVGSLRGGGQDGVGGDGGCGQDASEAAAPGLPEEASNNCAPKHSIFRSADPKELAMLGRHYRPNVWAMAGPRACAAPVESVADDVQGWQLRCAARLRARQAALDGVCLEDAWRVQRREMAEADAFVGGWGHGASGCQWTSPAAEVFDAAGAQSRRQGTGSPARRTPVGGAGPLPPASSAGPRRATEPGRVAANRPEVAAPRWPRAPSWNALADPAAASSRRPEAVRSRAPSARDDEMRGHSRTTAAEYLDELLYASPRGYAAAVGHLVAAAVHRPASSASSSPCSPGVPLPARAGRLPARGTFVS